MKKAKLIPIVAMTSLVAAIGASTPLLTSCAAKPEPSKKQGYYKIDRIRFLDSTTTESTNGFYDITRNDEGEPLEVTYSFTDNALKIAESKPPIMKITTDDETIDVTGEKVEGKTYTYKFDTTDLDDKPYVRVVITFYTAKQELTVITPSNPYCFPETDMDIAEPLVAKFGDYDITKKVKFEFVDPTPPEDKVWIVGDKIHVHNIDSGAGIPPFKVKATYISTTGEVEESEESDEILINVSRFEVRFTDDDMAFQAVAGHNNSSLGAFHANDGDKGDVTEDVDFTIIGGPSWLDLNDDLQPGSPRFVWGEDSTPGIYTFKVKAEYTPEGTETKIERIMGDFQLTLIKEPSLSFASKSVEQKMDKTLSIDLKCVSDGKTHTLTSIYLYVVGKEERLASIWDHSIPITDETKTITFNTEWFVTTQSNAYITLQFDDTELEPITGLVINPISTAFDVTEKTVQQAVDETVTFQLTCTDHGKHTLTNIKLMYDGEGEEETLATIDGEVTLNDGVANLVFTPYVARNIPLPSVKIEAVCDSYEIPAITGITVNPMPVIFGVVNKEVAVTLDNKATFELTCTSKFGQNLSNIKLYNGSDVIAEIPSWFVERNTTLVFNVETSITSTIDATMEFTYGSGQTGSITGIKIHPRPTFTFAAKTVQQYQVGDKWFADYILVCSDSLKHHIDKINFTVWIMPTIPKSYTLEDIDIVASRVIHIELEEHHAVSHMSVTWEMWCDGCESEEDYKFEDLYLEP